MPDNFQTGEILCLSAPFPTRVGAAAPFVLSGSDDNGIISVPWLQNSATTYVSPKVYIF